MFQQHGRHVHRLVLRALCTLVKKNLRPILAVSAQVGMADIVWSDAQYTYNDGSEVRQHTTGRQ